MQDVNSVWLKTCCATDHSHGCPYAAHRVEFGNIYEAIDKEWREAGTEKLYEANQDMLWAAYQKTRAAMGYGR